MREGKTGEALREIEEIIEAHEYDNPHQILVWDTDKIG